MRHHFQTQPDLQLTPIEKIRLPRRSRDELPPILAALQWLWMHPTLRVEILALIAAAVLADKKTTGRTGMDRWQILVLGVVRLGLDADWVRMEDMGQSSSARAPDAPGARHAVGCGRQNVRPPNAARQRRPAR